MLPKIGTMFHSLELLSYCGSGTFGDVFYCRDLSGRELAVKIISKQKLGSYWERELRGVVNYRRITGEAEGLLKIHFVGEDKDCFFYTMDAADSSDPFSYVPDTLASRLSKGPLSEKEIFPILSELFDGIRTIHQAGLVHRDIKPENILFVKGKPKIGDIGLLAALSESMTHAAGTLDYLPPEERGNSNENTGNLNPGNDLYAFGKVIYCVVTGQDSHQWPAIPENLPVTPVLKFFIRLSFRLCDRFPVSRLASLEAIACELEDIKRKLLFGETWKDRLLFRLKCAGTDLHRMLSLAAHLFRKHWLILLLLIPAGGGCLWYFWPEPTFDITQQKSKEYFNERLNLSMRIPFQWVVLNQDLLQQRLKGTKNLKGSADSVESRQLAFLANELKKGIDFICMDYTMSFVDNITVQGLHYPGDQLLELSDEELRFEILQQYQGELGFQTEIYALKRIDFKGISCIFLDLSHNPKRVRTQNYIFAMKDQCIAIAMTAKLSTFQKQRMKFESILKTLTFHKKTNNV